MQTETRYDRQLILPEIGSAGQERLRNARVLLVGAGGLGSPVALYLTGAGIGTLGLVDDDKVSITNLQRQILYTEAETGQSKVGCAARRLRALNSEVNIRTHNERFTAENALNLLSDYDLVVDGCDNFATRYLIQDTASALDKPYVYGAIRAFEGQVSVFNYPDSRYSYRDLFPDEEEMIGMPPPPKGVMGITPGIVGCVEATEVIKIICGFGEVLSGKLWTIDLRSMQSNIISL
ncbi:MAG: HesA/MoeB/ThiF family protein [Bacteroides sp.]|nr:HesA/MoeB/ThiF family protein [Bacteroides sp.]